MVPVKTPDGIIEVETVDGVDPSFAYNPGKAASGMCLSPVKIQEAQSDGTWKAGGPFRGAKGRGKTGSRWGVRKSSPWISPREARRKGFHPGSAQAHT